MRIVLVRHGEAASAEVDPAKGLSARGEAQARAVAGLLAPMALRLREIWHSGKARAEGTARILAAAMAAKVEPTEKPGLGPNDPVAPAASEIEASEAGVMLVGHLPFVSRLASLLLLGAEGPEVLRFPTATAACLARDRDGAWRVEWMVGPHLAGRA